MLESTSIIAHPTIHQADISTTSLPLEVRMQPVKMRMYYKVHADIYDMTRWTFLFGRQQLLNMLPYTRTERLTIIEIGSGTGYNLKRLAQKYPKAKLIGWDVSEDMIRVAEENLATVENKLQLINKPYGLADNSPEKADIILFSYCLTMVNPHWQDLILQAKKDLKPNGIIAVVDFHQTPVALYRRFMRNNHVEIKGQILPFLHQHFNPQKVTTHKAYSGIWQYFCFVGKNA
jgi:S-adenosylmethionine-diacylgycerolhomoserine-N-methlytransferase